MLIKPVGIFQPTLIKMTTDHFLLETLYWLISLTYTLAFHSSLIIASSCCYCIVYPIIKYQEFLKCLVLDSLLFTLDSFPKCFQLHPLLQWSLIHRWFMNFYLQARFPFRAPGYYSYIQMPTGHLEWLKGISSSLCPKLNFFSSFVFGSLPCSLFHWIESYSSQQPGNHPRPFVVLF